MSEPKKPKVSTQASQPNFFKSPAHLLLLIVIFIILIISAIYIKQNNQASTSPVITSNTSGPELSLTASDLSPMADGTVKISVWEDSQDQAVNAVQANLVYPADKFDYVDSDISTSAFEIEAQNTSDSGKIVIARAHKGNLTGRQLITIISLKAKSIPGSASLAFDNGSYLVSSVSNKDILTQSSGVDFVIGN